MATGNRLKVGKSGKRKAEGEKRKAERGGEWRVTRYESLGTRNGPTFFLQPDSRVKNYGEFVTARRRKARGLVPAS